MGVLGLTAPLLLPWSPVSVFSPAGCGDEEQLEGRHPVRHTCLRHGTVGVGGGVEDFDDTVHS